jgi:hypothetical protein
LPNALTSIGARAFYGCSKLTALVIPENVDSLGEQAFGNLANITSVIFENDILATLPDKLFISCTKLNTVILPAELKNIGNEVFSNCVWLEQIVLPKNLITLGERAFSNCTKLNQIIFNEKLETIGKSAFYKCESINNIVLPNSLTFIGEEIFASCTKLTSLTISALCAGSYSAPSINSVILTASVDSKAKVKDFAFNGIFSITEIELSKDIESIGENAFFNCKNLSTITYTAENNINSIGNYAFGMCAKLTSFAFNENVLDIGAGAFTGCASIIEVFIPSTIEIIESSTFANCINLENVVFEKDITTNQANLKTIKQNAFENCTRLNNINLPDSLEEIHSYAFASSGLYDITLPSGIISIQKGVFSNCNNLTKITASSVVSVRANAFYNCILLNELNLSQDLSEIGDYAFYSCLSLVNFVISDKVSFLGEGVFAFCQNLSDITVDINNPYYLLDDMGLYKYSTINSEKVRQTLVKYISNQGNLDYIIPPTVTSVNAYAFDIGADFTALYVPESVIKIGYQNIANEISIYMEKEAVGWEGNIVGDVKFYYNCNADKADFEYVQNEDSTYTVSKYIGKRVNASVPLFYNGQLVTRIGANTFNSATSLYGIFIQNKIDTIKMGAFDGCDFLYSISVDKESKHFASIQGVLFDKAISKLIKYPSRKSDKVYFIPQTVEIVNDFAFEKCSDLETLIAKSSVISMGAYAKLSDLHLYAEVTSKPSLWHETWENNMTSYNCYKNQLDFSYNLVDGIYEVSNYTGDAYDVIIPISYQGVIVKQIGNETFYQSNITSVEIPNCIDMIGNGAFSLCGSLTSIDVPKGVKHIPAQFAQQSSLSEIILPDSLISIGAYAFSGNAIQSITIPENVEEIGMYAFFACVNLEEISVPNKITEINEYTFADNVNLSNVILPDGISEIKDSAFYCCSSIKDISLPVSVINIGERAFEFANLAASLILPEKVATIGSYAFANCKYISEIILPKYLKNIGISVFEGCNKLNKIAINKTNEYFETVDSVLYNKAKSILYLYAPQKIDTMFALPSSVTSIADSAFYNNINLSQITLSANLEKIGKFAFYNCNLEAITIPNKITIINESTFEKCTNLKNIVFSENITIIEKYAFESCGFTTLVLPSKLVEIREGAFSNCVSLQAVPSMPSSLTIIGIISFSYCTSLTSITLSRNIEQIGDSAFKNCAIMSIIIPMNVTYIGQSVFAECKNLTTINVEKKTIPAVWHNWLLGAPDNVDVFTGYKA